MAKGVAGHMNRAKGVILAGAGCSPTLIKPRARLGPVPELSNTRPCAPAKTGGPDSVTSIKPVRLARHLQGEISLVSWPSKNKKLALVVSSDRYNILRGDKILFPIITKKKFDKNNLAGYELSPSDQRFAQLPQSVVVLHPITLPERFLNPSLYRESGSRRRLPQETVRRIIKKFSTEVLGSGRPGVKTP